jgi:hypothetical protein
MVNFFRACQQHYEELVDQLAAKRRTRCGGRVGLVGSMSDTGSGQKAVFNQFPDARWSGMQCKA